MTVSWQCWTTAVILIVLRSFQMCFHTFCLIEIKIMCTTHEQYISVRLVIFAVIYCLDVIFKNTNNNFIYRQK